MRNMIFLSFFLASMLYATDNSLLNQLGMRSPNKASENVIEETQNETCSNPRVASKSFLEEKGKNEAIECFDHTGRSEHELLALRDRLSELFSISGVIINFEKIPDDQNYQNAQGKHRYVMSYLFKNIYLEKGSKGWVFPSAVLDKVDSLYLKAKKTSFRPFYDLLPSWAKSDIWDIEGFSLWQIIMLLSLIFLGLGIRLIVAWLFSRYLANILTRFRMHQFEALVRKASYPIGTLAMTFFLGLTIPSLNFNVHITIYLMMAVRLGACIAAVMLAYRSVDLFSFYLKERFFFEDSKLDNQLVPLFRKGLKILIIVVGAIFILQNLNVDVTSLLAGVTIGGLAFSFAAKDTVANLFGSITIFADKPFVVGDWIKAANIEGIVEQVGFRSTRVRTFYNSLVSVPNSKFTDSVVDNMGARRYRRTATELGLIYDTSPEQIEAFCNGVRAIIKAHPMTRKDYYEVSFNGYGDFALKILLYYFIEAPNWSNELRCRHEIYLDILRLAKRMNVTFAFPTQTLHVETMAQAKEIRTKIVPSEEDLVIAQEYFAPNGEGVIPPGPRLGKSYFSHDR